MGHVHRFQRRLVLHTHTKQSRKYLRFHVQGKSYQFKALPFGVSTAPLEFTVVTKEVKLIALQKGIRIHQYLENWLVRVRSHQTCLQHTQTLVSLCLDLGWLVNMENQNWTQASFQLCRLPVGPERGQGQTHPGLVSDTDYQNQIIINRTDLSGSATDVPRRAFDSNRKTGPPRSTQYEAHTVAPQTKLEGPRIIRKSDTSSQIASPPSKMVAGGKQCAPRSTITPTKTCSAIV